MSSKRRQAVWACALAFPKFQTRVLRTCDPFENGISGTVLCCVRREIASRAAGCGRRPLAQSPHLQPIHSAPTHDPPAAIPAAGRTASSFFCTNQLRRPSARYAPASSRFAVATYLVWTPFRSRLDRPLAFSSKLSHAFASQTMTNRFNQLRPAIAASGLFNHPGGPDPRAC
jgi:hypothetical protein